MVSISFSMEPFRTASGVFNSCATLAESRSEADQAVLLLQPAEGGGQFVFLAAQRGDRFIPGSHDLADLVAQDILGRDHLALAVALFGSRHRPPAFGAAADTHKEA